MFLVEYRALLKRLNPLCTRALEAAAGLAISRGHYEICVEHLLLKLLEEQSGDLSTIYRALNISSTPVRRALQRGPRGQQRAEFPRRAKLKREQRETWRWQIVQQRIVTRLRFSCCHEHWMFSLPLWFCLNAR